MIYTLLVSLSTNYEKKVRRTELATIIARNPKSQPLLTTFHIPFRKRSDVGHRIYSPKKISIVLGSIYRTRPFKTMLYRDVRKITLHKNFTGNGDFDLAILHMVKAIPTNAVAITPIKLSVNALSPGTSCRISGWGEFSTANEQLQQRQLSDNLLSSEFQVVQNSECSSLWGGNLPSGMTCISSEMKRVCSGDLGAPVVCGQMLAGFVSKDTTCSSRQVLITSVAAYKSWIDANSSWNVKANFLLITVGMLMQALRVISA